MRNNLRESLQFAATKKAPLGFIDAIDIIDEITSQCGPHVEYETLLNVFESINRLCKQTPFVKTNYQETPTKPALSLLP